MIDYNEEVQPGLPKSLNLQEAVRDLNARVEALEGRHLVVTEEATPHENQDSQPGQ